MCCRGQCQDRAWDQEGCSCRFMGISATRGEPCICPSSWIQVTGQRPKFTPTRNPCPASGSASGKAGGGRWEGLASARFARWGTQPKRWRAQPHLTTSLKVRRLSLSSHSVSSLWSWLWICTLAARKVFVTVCNKETAPASPLWQAALPTSPPEHGCVSSVQRTGPGSLPASDSAVAVLQKSLPGRSGPRGPRVSAVLLPTCHP